jgi:hypothetical protein
MAKWTQVSKHEYEFLGAVPRYVSTGCGFFVGLGMLAGGVALLVYGTGGDNVSNNISAWIFVVLLVGFGLLTMGIAAALWPRQHVSWVRTYEEGLRWKAGGREHKKRWDEVKNVSRTEMQTVDQHGQGSEWGRTSNLFLHFHDGTSVEFFNALSDHGKLARVAQEKSAAAQLPAAAEELDDGGKTFGLIHVTRDGVTAFGKRFSWKKARWLAVENGHLVAHPACDGWEPVPLAAVDNYAVLLTLLQGIGRLRDHGRE